MLIRTLIKTITKRAPLSLQTRSYAIFAQRANGLTRSEQKSNKYCVAKTSLFTHKIVQTRFYSNEDALKDAGWSEDKSKVMEKMDELFLWVEKYYMHPVKQKNEHRHLLDKIHELIDSPEYYTVQDFCHYAFVGLLVAAFIESEEARTQALPIMQNIMRDEPAKLDFLNEAVSIWQILVTQNDKNKTPGKALIERLNDLDSIEDIDPFTKSKLFQGFFYFTGDLTLIVRMIQNFSQALKESTDTEDTEDMLVHIGLVASSIALAHSMAVPVFVKLIEDERLDSRLVNTVRTSVQQTLNHSIEI